jgi:hypothetical protein
MMKPAFVTHDTAGPGGWRFQIQTQVLAIATALAIAVSPVLAGGGGVYAATQRFQGFVAPKINQKERLFGLWVPAYIIYCFVMHPWVHGANTAFFWRVLKQKAPKTISPTAFW